MSNDTMTRRTFLNRAAAAAAGLTILGLGVKCGATPTPEIIERVVRETVLVEKPVVKIVERTVVKEVIKEVVKELPKEVTEVIEEPSGKIVVDQEICLTCRECELACSLYNEGKCSPTLSRIEVAFDDFIAGFPEISVSAKCDLCGDRSQGPVCVEVCPAEALTVVTT